MVRVGCVHLLLLLQVGSWDAFNVFRVKQLSGSRPLYYTVLAALHELGLVAQLELPMEQLCSFLEVRRGGCHRRLAHAMPCHATPCHYGALCMCQVRMWAAEASCQPAVLRAACRPLCPARPGQARQL